MSDGLVTVLAALLGGGLFTAIGQWWRDRSQRPEREQKRSDELMTHYVDLVRSDLDKLRAAHDELEDKYDGLERYARRLERALTDASIPLPD